MSNSPGTNQTGVGSIVPGTMVQPGPILSGQALRIGETVPATFDPRVSGLARPVGSVLYTATGAIAYTKTGSADTAWTIVAASSLTPPVTLTLADAVTNTSPDVLILQHTTSGTAAANFGLTQAIELESAGGTLRRVMTDVTLLQVATDAAEIARREVQLMVAGALQPCVAFGFRAGINAPALFLGPVANDSTLGSVAATVQMTSGGVLGQQWTATVVTSNIRHNFSARAEFNKGADVASATTLTLGADGNVFVITGATTINGITTANWIAGSRVSLRLPNGITVTHNSGAPGGGAVAILLRAAANLVTAKVYLLELVYDGTNWIQPD